MFGGTEIEGNLVQSASSPIVDNISPQPMGINQSSSSKSMMSGWLPVILVVVGILLFILYRNYTNMSKTTNSSVQPMVGCQAGLTDTMVNKTSNMGVNNTSNEKFVALAYTEWCGHSRMFKPTWAEFSKLIKTHNPSVNVVTYNCDKDEAMCSKYKVRGYPTVIMYNGSETKMLEGAQKMNTLVEAFNNHFM